MNSNKVFRGKEVGCTIRTVFYCNTVIVSVNINNRTKSLNTVNEKLNTTEG